MASHDLRFLQIQVNMEQAKDMPAVELMSKMDSIEFVVDCVNNRRGFRKYILCLKYSNQSAEENFEKQ